MKISSRQIAKRLVFKFSTLFILTILIFSTAIANAQSKKIFIDELEVSTGVTIDSNLPTTLDILVKGKMESNSKKGRYTISGKDKKTRININKELEVKTWEKNIVKQETTIRVKATNKEDENILLQKIKLSLKEKADSKVIIDCNLNIALFEISNSFFSGQEYKIVLDNGESYQIEYLEIETKITIPKESNLNIKGDNSSRIRLDELFGDLDLDLKYAEVYGSNVRKLRGNMRSCYNVHFDSVSFADLSTSTSYVNIKNVDEVNIGIQSLNKTLADIMYFQRDSSGLVLSNSGQSRYIFGTVGTLYVNKSGNDEIVADEVGSLEVTKTSHTSFQIKKLNTSAIISAGNSDIDIDNVSKKFTEIDIKNKLSNININMQEGAEYKLILNREKYIEADLKNTLKLESKKGAAREIYILGNNTSNRQIQINCEDCKLQIQ